MTYKKTEYKGKWVISGSLKDDAISLNYDDKPIFKVFETEQDADDYLSYLNKI